MIIDDEVHCIESLRELLQEEKRTRPAELIKPSRIWHILSGLGIANYWARKPYRERGK